MNLLEFKRRLMTDPDSRDADFVAARRQGGEFAAAAAASDEFEKQLRSALDVPAPGHLAEDIILAQSMQPKRSVPRLTLFAAAACLVLAVAVGTLVWQGNGAIDGPTLDQHLVWHWELDGPAAIAASQQGAPDLDEAHRILAELGLHMDHALLESVRLSKFCPTPDGAGAHLILASEAGPITLFYMPRTRVADAPRVVSLPDGMEGRVINLERGSMAIIANAERDTAALVREIGQQLSVVPGMTL